MPSTRQNQPEKRKSMMSFRPSKRAKTTSKPKVHVIDDSADEDYLPTPDTTLQDEGDEDGYEDEDEDEDTTPLGGKATATKGKDKGKGKAGVKDDTAESYGTRKQVFHWWHYAMRKVIQSFGELEQVRLLRAHSERAKEHAHRKAQKAEQETIELQIKYQQSMNEWFLLLGPEERTAEWKKLLEAHAMEIRRAEDRSRELELELTECRIKLVEAETFKEQAVKDRMGMETKVLAMQREEKSVRRR
ncbi:unnamed protein product [Rhizoctonia solani]|uniref:Uncharacterized protein n=1 Tax=Rhizoctonia solani TaxID=456999 RepID=A0A8H3CA22_9AGAM|nr:unnamed protein product [Rhizoctonia solani]